jgi:aspartyl-tRNA(Asn)/glutamyl-tRNA(Gln) amidotransferase subunit A
MPGPPWQAGRATPEPYGEENWSWCPFAYPFNLTRQPAASVPMGLDANNLPLAVQLVAANGRDDLLLRASFALESA